MSRAAQIDASRGVAQIDAYAYAHRGLFAATPGMFWAFPPGDDSVYRTGLEVLPGVDLTGG